MRDLGRWILSSLIGSGIVLIACLFSGGLWALLRHLGDKTGAQVAWGAVSVLAAGFVILHILLVTLLALAILGRNMEVGGHRS